MLGFWKPQSSPQTYNSHAAAAGLSYHWTVATSVYYQHECLSLQSSAHLSDPVQTWHTLSQAQASLICCSKPRNCNCSDQALKWWLPHSSVLRKKTLWQKQKQCSVNIHMNATWIVALNVQPGLDNRLRERIQSRFKKRQKATKTVNIYSYRWKPQPYWQWDAYAMKIHASLQQQKRDRREDYSNWKDGSFLHPWPTTWLILTNSDACCDHNNVHDRLLKQQNTQKQNCILWLRWLKHLVYGNCISHYRVDGVCNIWCNKP